MTPARIARIPAAALLACSPLLVVPAVATAATASKTIGRAVHLKGTRVWYVHGTAVAPRSLSAKLDSVPRQPVKVQWAVVCQKQNPLDPADHLDTKETGGETIVQAASVVHLTLPYRQAPSCVATVYATLTKAGSVTLQLVEG